MKLKGLFLLGLGYIAGNVVSGAYNKKTGKKYKKELSENENSLKFVVDNFFETQKSFFEDIKKEISSEENMKIYEKYKTQILELFEDYKKKSEKLFADLKENGEEYLTDAKKSLKKIYEENKEKIENLTGLSEDKIKELKDKLAKNFEESKDKIKKIKKSEK